MIEYKDGSFSIGIEIPSEEHNHTLYLPSALKSVIGENNLSSKTNIVLLDSEVSPDHVKKTAQRLLELSQNGLSMLNPKLPSDDNNIHLTEITGTPTTGLTATVVIDTKNNINLLKERFANQQITINSGSKAELNLSQDLGPAYLDADQMNEIRKKSLGPDEQNLQPHQLSKLQQAEVRKQIESNMSIDVPGLTRIQTISSFSIDNAPGSKGISISQT